MSQRLTTCQWRFILRVLWRIGLLLTQPEDGADPDSLLGNALVVAGSKLAPRVRLVYNVTFAPGLRRCTDISALAAKANSFGVQLTGIIRRSLLTQWRARVRSRKEFCSTLRLKIVLRPILLEWLNALELERKAALLRARLNPEGRVTWLVKIQTGEFLKLWRNAADRRQSITKKLLEFQCQRYHQRSLQAYKLWGLATACSRHFENELGERHAWFIERRYLDMWCQAFIRSRRAARIEWNYETRLLEQSLGKWKQAQSNKRIERLGTDFALVGALALWRRNAWQRRKRRRVRTSLASRLILRPVMDRWMTAGRLRLKASLVLSRRQYDRALVVLRSWARRAARLRASRLLGALLLDAIKSVSFYKLAFVSSLLDKRMSNIETMHGRRVCSKALNVWKHRRLRALVISARGVVLAAVRSHQGLSLRSRLTDDVCRDASLLRVQWTRLQSIAAARISKAFYEWLEYTKRFKTTKTKLRSLEMSHDRRLLANHVKSWKKAVAVKWMGESCLMARQTNLSVLALEDWRQVVLKRRTERIKVRFLKDAHRIAILHSTLIAWAQTFAELEKTKAVLYAFREKRDSRDSIEIFQRWRIWAAVCGKRKHAALRLENQVAETRLRSFFLRWCTQYGNHVKLRTTLKPLLDLIKFQDLKLIISRWKIAVSFDKLGDLTLRRRLLTKYLRSWRVSTKTKLTLRRKSSKLATAVRVRLLNWSITRWLTTLRLYRKLQHGLELLKQGRERGLLIKFTKLWLDLSVRARRDRSLTGTLTALYNNGVKRRCLTAWRSRVMEKDVLRERLLAAILAKRGDAETETETSASSGLGSGVEQMKSLLTCTSARCDWESSEALTSFPMLSSPRLSMSSPLDSIFFPSEGTQYVSAVSERYDEPPAPVCVTLATATVCFLAASSRHLKDRKNMQWRRVLLDMRATHPLGVPIDLRGFVRLAASNDADLEVEFLARVYMNYVRSSRILRALRASISQGARRRQRCRELSYVLRLQMVSRWLIIWRLVLEGKATEHLCNLKTLQSRKALRILPKWRLLAKKKVGLKEQAILLHVYHQMENGRDSLQQWRANALSQVRDRNAAQSITEQWLRSLGRLALLSWRCQRVRAKGLRRLERIHRCARLRTLCIGVRRRLSLPRRLQLGSTIILRILLRGAYEIAFKKDHVRKAVFSQWLVAALARRGLTQKHQLVSERHKRVSMRNYLYNWRRKARRIWSLRDWACQKVVKKSFRKWQACLSRIQAQIGAEDYLASRLQHRYLVMWKRTTKMVTLTRIMQKVKMYTCWIHWKSQWQILLWSGLARDRLDRARTRRIMMDWIGLSKLKRDERHKASIVRARNTDSVQRKATRIWRCALRSQQCRRAPLDRLCRTLRRVGCRECFDRIVIAGERATRVAELGVVAKTMVKLRAKEKFFNLWRRAWQRKKSSEELLRVLNRFHRRRLLWEGLSAFISRLQQMRIVTGSHKLLKLFARSSFKLRITFIHLWQARFSYEPKIFQWRTKIAVESLRAFQRLLKDTVCVDRRERLKRALSGWLSVCECRRLAAQLRQSTKERRLSRCFRGWAVMTLKLCVERQKVLIISSRHRLPTMLDILAIWREQARHSQITSAIRWGKYYRDASRVLVVWLLAVQTEKYEQKVGRLVAAVLRPHFLRCGLEAFVHNVLEREWQRQVHERAMLIKADIIYQQALEAMRSWRRFARQNKRYRQLLGAHNFALSCAALERWRGVALTRGRARLLASKARGTNKTSTKVYNMEKIAPGARQLPERRLLPPMLAVVEQDDERDTDEARGKQVALGHKKDLLLKAYLLWKWKWQTTLNEDTTEPSSQDVLALHRPALYSMQQIGVKSEPPRILPVPNMGSGGRDVFHSEEPKKRAETQSNPESAKVTKLSNSVLDPFSGDSKRPKIYGGREKILADSNARMERVSKRLGISTIDLGRIDEQQPRATINVEQFLQDEIDYLQRQTELLSPPTFGQL